MPFVIFEEDEKVFLDEHNELPDRIIGLVMPVFIDRRLEQLIRDGWKDTAKSDLHTELFRDGGALGSFYTRVQIGFAIGLYDEKFFDDLRRMVKIRNAFAHQPGARNFNAQPVCDFSRGLQLPDRYPKEHGPEFEARGTRDQVVERLMRTSGLIDIGPLRHRFLRAVEIALTWFSIKSGSFKF